MVNNMRESAGVYAAAEAVAVRTGSFASCFNGAHDFGGNGKGEENLVNLFNADRTVASYIKNRYDKSRFGKIGNEINFFVRAREHNPSMPENLYLLPGDMDLDVCSLLIDYFANAPEKNSWYKSRALLADLIEPFEGEHKNGCVTFIDSNPSFANYTQMGVVIADRIIVPCTADSASLRGISNILRLVLGIKDDSRLSEEIFDTFHNKMTDGGKTFPKIHSFILNKARTKDAKATKAYKAHVAEIKKLAGELHERHARHFSSDGLFELKDGNTLAVVLNHNGIPPSELSPRKYKVYDDDTQVNKQQIETFMSDLHNVVGSL